LLLHIALRRQTARHDFDGMARLIRTADELGLANSPVVSQSAEMLQRFAAFAVHGKQGCLESAPAETAGKLHAA